MEQLSESTPDAIEAWCVRIRQVRPVNRKQAQQMLDPLIDLNYNKLSPDLVKTVEDTLYYGVFGHERGASPKTRPTPGFSAKSTSPSRRSSASFSSGWPKFPKAV